MKTIKSNIDTRKFQLIVRDTNNFKDRLLFKFSYVRLGLFVTLFIIALMTLSIFITRKVLGKFLDPTYIESKNKGILIKLQSTIEKLEKRAEMQDLFIETLHKTLANNKNTKQHIDKFIIATKKLEKSDVSVFNQISSGLDGLFKKMKFTKLETSSTIDFSKYVPFPFKDILNLKKRPIHNEEIDFIKKKAEKDFSKNSQFIVYNNMLNHYLDMQNIKKSIDKSSKNIFKQRDIFVSTNLEDEDKPNSLKCMYFIAPVQGIISAELDTTAEHYGIDIVANKNTPIKSIADGIITFSGWTIEDGNVIILQHKKNLISIYKHNSQLLKKIGAFVKKGEAIAIIGNSGEYTTGHHLHFEMWHNGNPINPQDYIIFK